MKQQLLTANKIRIAFASIFIIIAVIIPRPSRAQEPITGYVGVAYTTGNGQMNREGVIVFSDYPVIESVEPNSPADRAGLSAGDTILAMNSQDLRRSPLPMASMVQPGKRIVFRYRRNDVVREATVTVGTLPEGSRRTFVLTITPPPGEQGMRLPSSGQRDRAITEIVTRSAHPVPILPAAGAMGFQRSLPVLGAEITALNDGLRTLLGLKGNGIFVVNVGAGTPASESGLREADVILRAERRPVSDPIDLMRVLSEMNKGSLQLNIIRMKKPQTITLRW